MKTWFDEQRLKMINRAAELVLSPQIQGPLSFANIIQLAGYIERANTQDVIKNSMSDLSKHNIDILSEMSQAIVAEAVSTFDNVTISNLKHGGNVVDVVDFEDFDTMVPTYAGDKFSLLNKKIEEVIKNYPHDNGFVLVTPVVLSIMQCASTAIYENHINTTFKGPNNTILVGHIHIPLEHGKIPVYVYTPFGGIYDTDNDVVIVGNYIDGADTATTYNIEVRNISFT